MMGQLPPSRNTLFYDFCLEEFVSQDHLRRDLKRHEFIILMRLHLHVVASEAKHEFFLEKN